MELDSLALFGGIIGAAGSIFGGASSRDAYNQQAAIHDWQAEQARRQSQYEQDRHATDTRRFIGTAKADIAGRGITLEGGAQDIIEDIATQAEFDRLAIAYSGEIQEANSRLRASSARITGRNQYISSLFTGASSLASGYTASQTIGLQQHLLEQQRNTAPNNYIGNIFGSF